MIARVKEMSADGKTNREIAEEVGISHTTVGKYLKA
ncbi:MAG: helix-turn-helix domain-containing protein [Chloracidobacterium sp.]|nr:helix-turn-helix domain-containing protein [Chloracidobacterium sp.]